MPDSASYPDSGQPSDERDGTQSHVSPTPDNLTSGNASGSTPTQNADGAVMTIATAEDKESVEPEKKTEIVRTAQVHDTTPRNDHPHVMDASERKPPVTVRDDTTWTTGNFAIISSDGVRFRVDAHHLMAASPTWAHLLETGGGERELTLLDPSLERSNIISAFLGLIVNMDLDTSLAIESGNNTLVHLIQFIEKYRAETARKAVTILLQAPRSTISPLALFVIGATLNDPDICCEALTTSLAKLKQKYSSVAVADTRALTDPSRLPFGVYTSLPPPYAWAVSHACDRAAATAARSRYRDRDLELFDLEPEQLSLAFREALAEAQSTTASSEGGRSKRPRS